MGGSMGKRLGKYITKNVVKRATKQDSALMFFLACWVVSGFFASSARCEVTSCQAEDRGVISSCMEFASSKPIPPSMEKVCTLGSPASTKWVKNPCPRSGIIGYCEVLRKDTITQVVYCYKRAGVPDKQKLEFCKQACKGRFAVY
jgi:hypothetical protein